MSGGLKNALTVLSIGLALFVPAACTATPPAAPTAFDITFQHREPIILRVSRVDVVDRHEPLLRAPRVEHLYDVTPASIIDRWAAERLKPVGAQGLVTLIVEEAGVIEERLPVSTGIGDLFRDEPDTRLTGVIRARFDHVDIGPPSQSRSVEILAEASVEVLESATLNERDLAYYRVVEKLAGEVDRVLTSEINKSMGSLIVR